MNEQLKVRLGEFLLSHNLKFSEVQNLELYDAEHDYSSTVDIHYVDLDGRFRSCEIGEYGFLEFATFLVTGGK